MNYFLGFDPGGKGKFGWAVVENARNGRQPILKTGRADHALDALQKAASAVPLAGSVVGVGVDAPLYWYCSGSRVVDTWLQKQLVSLHAPFPCGTVQHINSLRGGCVAQGIMVAALAHEQWPSAGISEAHPKAYLWLRGVVSPSQPELLDVGDIPDLDFSRVRDSLSEDKRDAAICALSAWAAQTQRGGWHNVSELDPEKFGCLSFQVSYWLPLAVHGN